MLKSFIDKNCLNSKLDKNLTPLLTAIDNLDEQTHWITINFDFIFKNKNYVIKFGINEDRFVCFMEDEDCEVEKLDMGVFPVVLARRISYLLDKYKGNIYILDSSDNSKKEII